METLRGNTEYLQVYDNNQLNTNDKINKIRHLYSLINDWYLQYFPMGQDLSIDETMIPYFGKHNSKQLIRGKPIRFGFKLRFYYNKAGLPHSSADRHELGICAGVVLDLISEFPRLRIDCILTILSQV